MKIIKKDKVYVLDFEDKSEEKLLDSFINKKLNIKNINNSVFCLSLDIISNSNSSLGSSNKITNKKLDSKDSENYKLEIKQKILNLLNDKNLDVKHRVQGKFEYLLSKKDQEIFKEMLDKEEVFLFKLSDKYKKGIYKTNLFSVNSNDVDHSSSSSNSNNINSDKAYSSSINKFKKEKFIILKNSASAQKFSNTFKKEIESKNIIGIKSFDGSYNIIYRDLYEKVKNKILDLKTNKDFGNKFTIDELYNVLKIDKTLIKIVLEILKEDILIIESRKNIFSFI